MTRALKIAEHTQAPATIDPPSFISMLARAISDPTLPIERMEQFFAFHQTVEADNARKSWASAFVAAQGEMSKVKRDRKNNQTNSNYVTFEALDAAIRPIYSKHGFAPSFDTEESDKPDHIRIVMNLLHVDGHERRYHIDMPADGKGAKGGDVMTKTHAAGSAMSYGKRYLLGSAFNVVATDRDDDGNAAGGAVPDAPITDEQVNFLIELADKVGADKARFCKFYGISSFSDIMQSKFKAAKDALEKKGRG